MMLLDVAWLGVVVYMVGFLVGKSNPRVGEVIAIIGAVMVVLFYSLYFLRSAGA